MSESEERYELVCFAGVAHTDQTVAVYRPLPDGAFWTILADEFHEWARGKNVATVPPGAAAASYRKALEAQIEATTRVEARLREMRQQRDLLARDNAALRQILAMVVNREGRTIVLSGGDARRMDADALLIDEEGDTGALLLKLLTEAKSEAKIEDAAPITE